MNYKIAMVSVAFILILGACKPLHPLGGPPGQNPNHCPPGHAKKGHC